MGRRPKPQGEKAEKMSIALPPSHAEFVRDLAVELFLATGGGLSDSFRRGERPSLSWAIRYLVEVEIARRTVEGWTWTLVHSFEGGLQIAWKHDSGVWAYQRPWNGAAVQQGKFLPMGHSVPTLAEAHKPIIVSRKGPVTPTKRNSGKTVSDFVYGKEGSEGQKWLTVDDVKNPAFESSPDLPDMVRNLSEHPKGLAVVHAVEPQRPGKRTENASTSAEARGTRKRLKAAPRARGATRRGAN